MGAIGSPITPSIPTVGSAGPQFATDINAILTEVVSRLSVKVPLSSIDFVSDLNLSGSALLNAAYVTLANTTSTPGSSPVNRLTAFLGDLFYVSPSGPIQITTGAALNSASIGGITGAYGGANPAQFRFDAVNQRYDAYGNFATNSLARLRSLSIDIAPTATSAVFARLAFGGVANKTYTLPPAAATSTDRPLYMDTTGAITLGHGVKTYAYSACNCSVNGAITSALFLSDRIRSNIVGSFSVQKSVDSLLQGFTINSVEFSFNKLVAANTTFRLVKSKNGVATTLATGNSVTLGINNQTVALGVPEVVAADTTYSVEFTFAAGDNGADFYGFQINGILTN